ncbi:MAG: 4-(cytidine 5'-diphospho)-2-C-methyl-D-erythritol kinase [Clostridiales bacterium]|nr:4-(cytidine 5'-diphospho)-2-C-methyl-D-erythritol kinase [Clostridiales bacterium]
MSVRELTVTVDAPAKVNLSLDVLSRRDDGYHELRMVMQSVSLCDTLTITVGEPGTRVALSCNIPYLPTDRRNLAVAAVRHFFEITEMSAHEVTIILKKRIPLTAGLAGGSTDAAAVLRALNRMLGTGMPLPELADRSLPLGADVPFCVLGGTALAEGIGECLTPLPDMPDCAFLLCKPPFTCSTAAVFSSLNLRRISQHPDTSGMLRALESGDLAGIARRMFNVLEAPVTAEHAVISDIRHALLQQGALGVVMSGSGPTIAAIFPDAHTAARARRKVLPYCSEIFAAAPLPPA